MDCSCKPQLTGNLVSGCAGASPTWSRSRCSSQRWARRSHTCRCRHFCHNCCHQLPPLDYRCCNQGADDDDDDDDDNVDDDDDDDDGCSSTAAVSITLREVKDSSNQAGVG